MKELLPKRIAQNKLHSKRNYIASHFKRKRQRLKLLYFKTNYTTTLNTRQSRHQGDAHKKEKNNLNRETYVGMCTHRLERDLMSIYKECWERWVNAKLCFTCSETTLQPWS